MTTAPGKAKTRSASHFADSRLVKECLHGNQSAWSELVDKYKNLIFSIPIRYGFSEDESADIFQEVCIDLLNELPRLREPNALAGWLIRVARNKCYHRKQSQQRLALQQDDPDELEVAASLEEPEGAITQTQQEQMLREALLDLSPRCRKLVQMLFFETPARPYQQVAGELELALGSVGFIRRRCLEKLRKRLEQMGI